MEASERDRIKGKIDGFYSSRLSKARRHLNYFQTQRNELAAVAPEVGRETTAYYKTVALTRQPAIDRAKRSVYLSGVKKKALQTSYRGVKSGLKETKGELKSAKKNVLSEIGGIKSLKPQTREAIKQSVAQMFDASIYNVSEMRGYYDKVLDELETFELFLEREVLSPAKGLTSKTEKTTNSQLTRNRNSVLTMLDGRIAKAEELAASLNSEYTSKLGLLDSIYRALNKVAEERAGYQSQLEKPRVGRSNEIDEKLETLRNKKIQATSSLDGLLTKRSVYESRLKDPNFKDEWKEIGAYINSISKEEEKLRKEIEEAKKSVDDLEQKQNALEERARKEKGQTEQHINDLDKRRDELKASLDDLEKSVEEEKNF